MKYRISLFLLSLGITLSLAFSILVPYASREVARRTTFLYEVSFDAAIITDDVTGVIVNSDGLQGEEIVVPANTPVHVTTIKINEDVRVDTPVQVEGLVGTQEVLIGYFSLKNLDKADYARELLDNAIRENTLDIDRWRSTATIVAVLIAVAFSLMLTLSLNALWKQITSDKGRRMYFLVIISIFGISLIVLTISVYLDSIRL